MSPAAVNVATGSSLAIFLSNESTCTVSVRKSELTWTTPVNRASGCTVSLPQAIG